MSVDALLGLDGLSRLADPALQLPGADAVEVVVTRQAIGLTRFANSQIHQNVWTDTLDVGVRVVVGGGRSGVVRVTTDDPAQVRSAAEQALALAQVAPPDPHFAGLAPSAAVAAPAPDEATIAASPADRAAAVAALLAEVPDDVDGAGAFETGATELGVFTSAGQAVAAVQSRAELTVVLSGPSSSGYAQAGGRGIGDVDAAAAGRHAAAKVVAGAAPGLRDVEAGVWPVVLEPAATGALVEFLAYLGFGGRAYLEGRTCTSGRLGEAVLDPRLTIVDDAQSFDTIGFPFDFEGTPKQRVPLVQDGTFAAVVHDRSTGKRAGGESTGHALPAPNTFGPMPLNPLLLPGDGGSVENLVANCRRGLLVTRFHYVNVAHPVEVILTGMTRDGTFLIEDGRVVAPVRNLRFTQSVLEALASVDAVGTETAYASELFGTGGRYPALRLPAFMFTSTTTF